ncbi:ER membrane protein SH3-domain-containing protein [Protomyces lactucae-debilis]|uniref:acyl-CoA oxidase n=1 Tax=Protomyces lactucae-debilis TaxID=2754530 RepID=A0A1Y2F0G3_PROLT|nr:ER membrane protein SH3-domain-containing protein [Protomyces lactucae-debilis]ORY77391.1 ER membrane protein SH3-domain-containing protein [Protomyces lactucae-debilis]
MTAQGTKDLAKARSQLTFDPTSLTAALYPATGRTRAQTDHLVSIVSKEAIFNKDDRRYMNRVELLQRAYAMQLRLTQLCKQHGWDYETLLGAMGLLDDHVPFGLHYTAFVPVVKSQGSDEQIAQWLPRCMNLEVVGCYAQTELGHGSNVQGLETRAKYDHATKTFALSSPSLTATKWWIGGLGTMANHTVLQAQLFMNNKNLGPHLFIVPVRDLKTHEPLPGITVGDIGPKHYGGFAMVDNGFLRFSGDVRIPASNMLSRYAQIDAAGHYRPAGHAKIGYGSMVALRAGMPFVLGTELAKGVTIAIRYTTVRRQFAPAAPIVTDKLEDGVAPPKPAPMIERQVIEYGSVRERLVPLLAKSYVYILTGHGVGKMYKEMLAKLVAPPHDASRLAEVHLVTSGLKAALSWSVVQGLEEARKSMGGHGFSSYAGIGERFAKEVPGQTYEGDNYVLVQQTARGLLKCVAQVAKGQGNQLDPSTQFMQEALMNLQQRSTGKWDWTDRTALRRVLDLRCAALAANLAKKLQQGEDFAVLNLECARLTMAFADCYCAATALQTISTLPDASVRARLEGLVEIFMLEQLKASAGDLAEFDITTGGADLRALRQHAQVTMQKLTVDGGLIGLTDAFGFTDWELNSVLGRADGNVYESLWKHVNERNPVNQHRVVPGWKEHIRPLRDVHAGQVKALLYSILHLDTPRPLPFSSYTMVFSRIGQAVILSTTMFCLGCLLMNWTVDHKTLWESGPTPAAFDAAEHHYRSLYQVPHVVKHTLHTIIGVGILAHVVKMHKGNQSNTLFDGGSLVLTMIAVMLYVSNLVKGIEALALQAYEDLTREDSIRVIAASNVILGLVLFGVLVLQIGQGYAEQVAEREQLEFEKETNSAKKTE